MHIGIVLILSGKRLPLPVTPELAGVEKLKAGAAVAVVPNPPKPPMWIFKKKSVQQKVN